MSEAENPELTDWVKPHSYHPSDEDLKRLGVTTTQYSSIEEPDLAQLWRLCAPFVFEPYTLMDLAITHYIAWEHEHDGHDGTDGPIFQKIKGSPDWRAYRRAVEDCYRAWRSIVGDEPGPPRRETIPPILRKIVLERDAYRCQECDSWLDLQIDHIIPVAKGGSTRLENLQTLCRPCNGRKGARL